tara:strand:+ start:155 stop:814 length:660 start_codon:yes stop_codon:yes gene_type:complete
MKQCTKCNETKEVTEFFKDGRTPGKYRARCKPCIKAGKPDQSQYWKDRWKKIKANPELFAAANERNREYARSAQGKANYKKWYEKTKNTEHRRRVSRASQRSWSRKKYHNDLSYRLKTIVGVAVRHALKKQGGVKTGRTFEALPYTPQQLKEHLESQFQPWMTWENYGEWEIDHIYPQSLLPYDSFDHPNFLKCWSLDNLQPLGKIENIIKSNKVLSIA